MYLAVILAGLFAIFSTVKSVDSRRAGRITSFVSEWEERGKPVTAKEVSVSDIPVYTKITLIAGQDNSASGFVTGDIKDKLKKGQEVYLQEGAQVCGKILKIDQSMDIDTGMYKVDAAFDSSVLSTRSIIPVFVLSGELKNSLVVPNSVIDISGDSYSLWKIEEGRAKNVNVKIGRRDGYGTTIEEGLNSGDLVIYTGQSILKEGDKVNIIGAAGLFGASPDGRKIGND